MPTRWDNQKKEGAIFGSDGLLPRTGPMKEWAEKKNTTTHEP